MNWRNAAHERKDTAMNDVKAYNVIFPIWMFLFFPPVVFIALFGNFIIDSLVLIGCYYWFKCSPSLTAFYKKHIFVVWIFGFLADIIGAAILLSIYVSETFIGLPYELVMAISYNPFLDPWAFVIILLAILVSGLFIFLFNYHFTFKKTIEDKRKRAKVSLTIAVLTLPWTFLIPMDWAFG